MPAPDGPQWQFVHDAPEHHYEHTLIAYPQGVTPSQNPSNHIGYMSWVKGSGIVSDVMVKPNFRRQGVATALWNEANKIAQQTPTVPAPRHNSMRSRVGDQWARSVGGEVPPLKGDQFMPYVD